MSDPTKSDLSERDICTKFITPALVKAGWDARADILVPVAGEPLLPVARQLI